MTHLNEIWMCRRLISQQIASADSIAANIEEGYGRISRKEYIRFLDYSRGSARETRGRYLRMNTWIPAEILYLRVALLDEIISIISATIRTLSANPSSGYSVGEDSESYDQLNSIPEEANR